MKCEEIMKALALHLDGEVGDASCQELIHHLADCERCRVVVDNTQMTVRLFKEADSPVDLPEDCRRRLEDALRAAWTKKSG